MDKEVVELRRKIDAFLVDNQELETLSARLSTFNLFRVLNIEHAEIRHSNVLAWLLTPQETHGLGDRYLRRFISRLLMANENLDISLTPAKVELMALDDVEVMREWRNIDLLVTSRSANWCLLIENKIRGSESANQLLRYRKIVQEEMPEVEVIPIYLTLEGEEPSEEAIESGYISLSHSDVLALTQTLVGQYKSRIPHDAQVFLDHYLGVLRRLTMQDEELVELCKTIYRKHKEAIELIVRYGSSSQVVDACQEMVESLPNLGFSQRAAERVWFLPTEMLKSQQEIELNGWQFLTKKYPVMWWFYYRKNDGKLQLTLEVGPIQDPVVRQKLLREAKGAGFSFWEKGAFREEAKYTRILTEVKKLRLNDEGEPDDEPAYIQEVAGELWKKTWQEGSKILNVLKKVRFQ